jgi:hypothetical protein
MAAIPILIFCASFAPQIGSRPKVNPVLNVRHSAAPTEAGTPASAPDPDAPGVRDPLDDSQGNVDLYGNDVTDAVAQYKFDGTGALYELHSPQTEVARLPSPKS